MRFATISRKGFRGPGLFSRQGESRYSARGTRWLLRACLVVSLLCASLSSAVGKEPIAVVYPEVREPYATLYRDYARGIREGTDHTVETIVISANGDGPWRQRLSDAGFALFVALGNNTVRRLRGLDADIPLVGALTTRESDVELDGGLLLRPSAQVYLDNLFAISDSVRKVFVVYDPGRDAELIEAARKILEARDIAFHALPAGDLRQAAARYREIFRNADPHSAVWLHSDKRLLDSSLLSFILDVAWEKRLVVFSSNPIFVQHGALFAIYPDSRAIGRELGAIASRVAAGEKVPLATISHVRLAVNDRTRSHLGLELTPAVKEKVDLLLPGN